MILVFGIGGQVASELSKFSGVKCVGRPEADLAVAGDCQKVINFYSPHAVINAAAYTDVDGAELDIGRLDQVNTFSPVEMASCCKVLKIPFIHISSDYVFDGTGSIPWIESDLSIPLNAYGNSKLMADIGILSILPDAVIIRPSWVFSSIGRNFLTTILRLASQNSVISVVSDQVGGPTSASSIARVCYDIAVKRNSGCKGVFHFCGFPYVSRAEFAREILSLAKIPVDVVDISTKDYFTAADRPLNSRLDCSRFIDKFGVSCPDWRTEVKKVLLELGIS